MDTILQISRGNGTIIHRFQSSLPILLW